MDENLEAIYEVMYPRCVDCFATDKGRRVYQKTFGRTIEANPPLLSEMVLFCTCQGDLPEPYCDYCKRILRLNRKKSG